MPQQNKGAPSTIDVPTDSTYRDVTIGDHTIKITELGHTTFGNKYNWDTPLRVGPPEAHEDWKNDLDNSIRELYTAEHPIRGLTNYLPTGTSVYNPPNKLPTLVELPKDIDYLDGIVLVTGLWLGRELGLKIEEISSILPRYLSDKDALERIMNDSNFVVANK